MRIATFTIEHLEKHGRHPLQVYRGCAVEVADAKPNTLSFDIESECWRELKNGQARGGSAIARAANGVVGVARAVTGTGGATAEQIEKRAAICGQCPHRVMLAGVLQKCDLCGCSIWAKIRNVTECCPDSPPRW